MNDKPKRYDSSTALRAQAVDIEEAAEVERMAEKIVANTDEYETTDGVIEDFPTKPALATKLNQIDGVTANAHFDDPVDVDVGSGVLTENTDSDDDDTDGFDVDSGVLT